MKVIQFTPQNCSEFASSEIPENLSNFVGKILWLTD